MKNKKSHAPLKITDEDSSQYYLSLYFEALKRIDRVNDIKVSFLKLSLVSTFAYFAWLFTYHANVQALSENLKLAVWLMPFLFNLFGFLYNLYLKMIATRFGRFTRYLIGRIGGIHHVYDEFLADEKPFRCHLSQLFWLIISIFSLVFGIAGARIGL